MSLAELQQLVTQVESDRPTVAIIEGMINYLIVLKKRAILLEQKEAALRVYNSVELSRSGERPTAKSG